MSAINRDVCGANSDGFTTAQLPAASAPISGKSQLERIVEWANDQDGAVWLWIDPARGRKQKQRRSNFPRSRPRNEPCQGVVDLTQDECDFARVALRRRFPQVVPQCSENTGLRADDGVAQRSQLPRPERRLSRVTGHEKRTLPRSNSSHGVGGNIHGSLSVIPGRKPFGGTSSVTARAVECVGLRAVQSRLCDR